MHTYTHGGGMPGTPSFKRSQYVRTVCGCMTVRPRFVSRNMQRRQTTRHASILCLSVCQSLSLSVVQSARLSVSQTPDPRQTPRPPVFQ